MDRLASASHGWRLMVRLGAALCGSVMYGLVRLAWRVELWKGAEGLGVAGTVRTGYARCGMERFGWLGMVCCVVSGIG